MENNELMLNKQEILIGSMLWVVDGESDEQMERDIRGMLDNGLTIARIFIGTNFDTWDRFFALCEKLGLKLTITLHSLCATGARRGEVASEEAYLKRREQIIGNIERIVDRYKSSPAVHSWILQNEPNLHIGFDACSITMFRKWLLRERFCWDLDALKKAYRGGDTSREIIKRELTDEEKAAIEAEYLPFSETIGYILPDGTANLPGVNDRSWSYIARIDWAYFNEWLMYSQLLEANLAVKRIDKIHPTTINPAGCATLMPAGGGENIYTEGKTVDFLGCSCHVSWHSTRFASDRVHQSVAMYCDEMRCSTADPDEYYWITELQSGTNYFSGGRPMAPKATDITHWLWEAIGTGCKGMVYWLYSPRPSGFECLEWGLLNQQGGPSRRSKASKAVADLIGANRELFAQTKPKKYDGVLLHSYDSITLSYSDRLYERPRPDDINLTRNGYMVRDALCGAYLMCQDAGLDVGFVNEHDMDKRLADAKFVIAPNTYGVGTGVIKKLRDYVENGGTLIVDGMFGMKNPYGNVSNADAKGFIKEMFSDTVTDWGVDLEPFSYSLENGTELPAWFLNCSFEDESGLTVLARDEEGYASIIEHKLGSGRAIYIGTQFFQNYFAKSGVESYVDFLSSILPELNRPYTLENASAYLRMKVLEGERDIVIVMNRGGDCEAVVSAEAGGEYTDLCTGESVSLGKSSVIPMNKMQVRVLAKNQ